MFCFVQANIQLYAQVLDRFIRQCDACMPHCAYGIITINDAKNVDSAIINLNGIITRQ